MSRRMRLERDAARAPPLDVAPGEVREPSAAVGHVPSIQPAGEVRDHEASGGEPHIPQHGERVVAKTAVRVVEGDEEIAIARSLFAAHRCLELDERNASPAGGGQRVHLHREPVRGDARDAELSASFDLVIAEDGRDHAAVRSKPRAVKRRVWGQTPSVSFRRISDGTIRRESDPVCIIQTPVLPKPPTPRVLCSSSVASTSSGVS